jgi:rubrerythrin
MMRKGAMVANELAESSMIADLKNAFGAWADNFEESAVVEDAEALYRKANQLEQDSIAFYTDLKQKAETPPERQALDFIIGQEKIHARMTEALVDFARNPKQWVEDAEFRNISEY